MGTAEFAVPTLAALIENGYSVSTVITAPDKPAGRGRKIKFSPVKEAALKLNIPLLQPANLKDPCFQEQLQKINPDLQIVVAFRMLPESVWALPYHGTINLHASLLPQYRGAAPINHAIINGEKETGVTTFMIDKEIDTGKVLFTDKIQIADNETAGELHDRLMLVGARLVIRTLQAVQSGSLQPISQTELINADKIIRRAPKIFREDCNINWNKSGIEVHNFIRGMSPSPGAFTVIKLNSKQELMLKVYKSELDQNNTQLSPGSYVTNHKSQLGVGTKKGVIYLKEVQLQGKKRMHIDDFLRGFNTQEILCFSS